MGEKVTAFRVTGRLTVDYQIVVQAKDSAEAEGFATLVVCGDGGIKDLESAHGI